MKYLCFITIFSVISIYYYCVFTLFNQVTFVKFIYKVVFFEKLFMHETVQNLLSIQSSIKSKLIEQKKNKRIPKIIAVSKTFKINHILPLIEYGHLDYGENKVQEAIEKWTDVKKRNDNINLHLIGKLQTNKVKFAVRIFDKLRRKTWYIAPLISSIFGSIVDTFLFFSISFYGTDIPWITLAFGDLSVKLFIALSMLIPFRLLLSSIKDFSEIRR